MSENNYILEIKTIQASTIKSVIDAMKEILMDVNLEFDENGMKIVALDNTHIVLIHFTFFQYVMNVHAQCTAKMYTVLKKRSYSHVAYARCPLLSCHFRSIFAVRKTVALSFSYDF